MKKNPDISINIDSGRLTNAVPLSQRPLPGEIVYRFTDWVRDWYAGRRDRTILRASLEHARELEPTPWMRSVTLGCHTAIQRERRDASAMQADLRRRGAALIAEHETLAGTHAAREAAVTETLNADVDDNPRTAGEALETPAVRLERRKAEHAKRHAAAQAAANAARQRQHAITSELEELREEYTFNEYSYQRRTDALACYYNKRIAVYIRHGLHKAVHDGHPAIIPVIEIPTLTADAFPALAGKATAAEGTDR